MTSAEMIEWATRAGALSGLLALIWGRMDRWRDRSTARTQRLSVVPENPNSDTAWVRATYTPESAAQALVVRLEVIRPKSITLTGDVNGARVYDPATGTSRLRENLTGSKSIQLPMHLRHGIDPASFEVVALAIGSIGSGLKLKVTVSTWPTAKVLTQQKRTISAHV